MGKETLSKETVERLISPSDVADDAVLVAVDLSGQTELESAQNHTPPETRTQRHLMLGSITTDRIRLVLVVCARSVLMPEFARHKATRNILISTFLMCH